jgi:rifampicin phosphotransferase
MAAPASRTGTWVLALRDSAACDVALSGSKAANLAKLLAAGFPVPDGFVVTTTAFAAQCHGRTAPAAAKAAVLDLPLADSLADAFRDALRGFAGCALAVRSSAVAEDLPNASFAGQYESILGIRSEQAAESALRRCWASAFSPRLSGYLESVGARSAPMAVLVQRLVEADAAGVAFTADPVGGDRRECRVSAVRGSGERLVSGAATPDEWLVRGGQARCQAAPERTLDAGQVLEIAALARRVEALFGVPQDIEWARADGILYLLQARPISTRLTDVDASPAPGSAPPAGFWRRADSHYPLPLYPFTRSVLLPAANRGFRRMCSEFGLLTETVEEREIDGYVYLRAVPIGGKDRPPPPDWLMRPLLRIVPALRNRVHQCVEAQRGDRAGQWLVRWRSSLRVGLEARIDALRSVRLATLDDSGLDRHLADTVDLLGDSQEIHMLLNQSQNLLLAEFAFACRDLLRWDDAQAFDLLAGLSHASSAPAQALARLADIVRGNPALLALLEEVDEASPACLASADADFADAFARYRRDFCFRTIRYEVADPTLAETPSLILTLLRDQLQRGYDPTADADALAAQRASLVERAREALTARSAADRARFERALERAAQAYPVREEHGFCDTMMPLALVRHAALELGRRLALDARIARREDVFHLELDEARAALHQSAPLHALVEQRRLQRQHILHRPGPASFGPTPAQPPSFAALPAEARFVHEAVVWFMERVFAAAASGRRQTDARLLRGTPASAGSYTGPVRVIRTESEFSRLRPGDVLVCPITSPVWSVLFPLIGALITDTGGILSHSAIIAREYRIPAVVATGNASELLRDGQVVFVDGRAGLVTVLGSSVATDAPPMASRIGRGVDRTHGPTAAEMTQGRR